MSTSLGNIGLALKAAFGPLLDKAFGEELRDEVARAAGEEVQRQAIELTPYRTGRLEGSSELVVENGRAIVSFNTDYAAEAHERPETAVGPGTLAKPGNELGPSGPKFLERPIIAMQERLEQIGADALQRKLQEEL